MNQAAEDLFKKIADNLTEEERKYYEDPAKTLAGRIAICANYGKKKPKGKYFKDECNCGCRGKSKCCCRGIPSLDIYDKVPNKFHFEYRPKEKYDKFYCGCHGWD